MSSARTDKNKYNNLYQGPVISTIARGREGNTIDPRNLYNVFQKTQKIYSLHYPVAESATAYLETVQIVGGKKYKQDFLDL